MATSPIYSWPEPDNTDLVKNGALAIRTLGNAIDTTMGTMVAKTVVDAKGDLIAGTAADTVNRLAVGNNGETLVADSSTSTGLRYQTGYNGNTIINGGLDIWQRGTSIAVGAAIVYTADRWQSYRQGVVTGATVSRQSSSLTGIQYCARVQRDSGNTSTASINFNYQLESGDSYRFANTPVTMSFYARAGANYSSTSNNLFFGMRSGTGTDQTQVGGFTGATTVGSGTAVLTTSWQRFTVTGTPASTITQMGVYFYSDPTGTAGANDYFEVTGVQLEQGSVATSFKRSNGSGGTIQGELDACRRYFVRYGGNTSTEMFGTGMAYSSTAAMLYVPHRPFLRTSPTLTASAATNFRLFNSTLSGAVEATGISADTLTATGSTLLFTGSSGLASGNASFVQSDLTTNATLDFSAEL